MDIYGCADLDEFKELTGYTFRVWVVGKAGFLIATGQSLGVLNRAVGGSSFRF